MRLKYIYCTTCHWILGDELTCPMCQSRDIIPAVSVYGTNTSYKAVRQQAWVNRQMELHQKFLKALVDNDDMLSSHKIKMLFLPDLLILWESISKKDSITYKEVYKRLESKRTALNLSHPL